MSTRKPRRDPAEVANQQILDDIKRREDQKEAERTLAHDIGLDIKPEKPKAENAFEFLSDEWDRKSFGDPPATYTRIVYGPDPLLHSCPHMKSQIETVGLERYAQATAEAIVLKEERAVSDPVMQRGLRSAIAAFGVQSVAEAFKQRIMKIPQRTVEVEAGSEDPMLLARPLEEAVERYGTAGMAPKFLSERCIQRFGLRGYVIVKDEKGDPVKVGTLVMGEIPKALAERRQRFYVEKSNEALATIEEGFHDSVEREIHGRGGFSVLNSGETIRSSAAGDFEGDPELTASYLGRSRETGFRLERQV